MVISGPPAILSSIDLAPEILVSSNGLSVADLTASFTAESPLGKALMGKKAGDEVELKTSRLTRYAVESVS